MKTNEILSAYLSENGVVHDLGSRVTEITQANDKIDESDTQVINNLNFQNGKTDFFLLSMFILLIIVVAILIAKMVMDLKSNYNIAFCVGCIIIILAVMHRLWRDKVRSGQLIKILPNLEKMDRLRVVLSVLSNEREYNLDIKNAFTWLTSIIRRTS